MAGRRRKIEPPPPDHSPQMNEDLCRILATQGPGLDSAQLAKDIIEVFGGPRRLAEYMYEEFTNAKCNQQTRQRYLEMIQRLIITNTN